MNEVIEKTVAALNKHSFKAEAAADKAAALARVMALIGPKAKVGIPGSATIRAIGLPGALRARGNEIYDHWADTKPDVRKKQLTADVLVLSANAVSATGEIVNMDGIGNRVAASIFGPIKVIFVVGKNKIAEDLEAARDRIKKIAAPRRARELNMKTPCAEKGECTDCNSPLRICRAELILHRAPSLTQTHVIIVDEELGN